VPLRIPRGAAGFGFGKATEVMRSADVPAKSAWKPTTVRDAAAGAGLSRLSRS
jgi:hypothetical protein